MSDTYRDDGPNRMGALTDAELEQIIQAEILTKADYATGVLTPRMEAAKAELERRYPGQQYPFHGLRDAEARVEAMMAAAYRGSWHLERRTVHGQTVLAVWLQTKKPYTLSPVAIILTSPDLTAFGFDDGEDHTDMATTRAQGPWVRAKREAEAALVQVVDALTGQRSKRPQA